MAIETFAPLSFVQVPLQTDEKPPPPILWDVFTSPGSISATGSAVWAGSGVNERLLLVEAASGHPEHPDQPERAR